MTTEIDIEGIACRLKKAQDDVGQIEPITTSMDGFGLAAAYEVAHRVHRARLNEGVVAVGRKIGFTNSALWPLYGVHAPIWGYVYDNTVTRAQDGHGMMGIGRLAEPKIEPEIVLHFREAPTVDSDLRAILGCVDWVAHAFELVQCHYPAWRFQAPDAVADSALHGSLFIGKPVAVGDLGGDLINVLESFTVTLLRDGEALETGRGENVLGGALAAAAHLVAMLDEQRQYPPLKAGELVTTGTLTAAYPVKPGNRWSTELDGIALGGLCVEIAV